MAKQIECMHCFEPPPVTRFAVEAAMSEMINRLADQGFDKADIALSLADAAEDYVVRLASSRNSRS